MNKDEHYQRLTQTFGEYLEAYRNYNNEREGDFDRLMALERKIHDMLSDSVFALDIQFEPDPGVEPISLNDLLDASILPDGESFHDSDSTKGDRR